MPFDFGIMLMATFAIAFIVGAIVAFLIMRD